MNLLPKFVVVWAVLTMVGCPQKHRRWIEDVAPLSVDAEVANDESISQHRRLQVNNEGEGPQIWETRQPFLKIVFKLN
ncbi:hypothetical protein SLA2020_399440 [Shorea laevis]|jgi:hypothetical protein